MTNTKTIIGTVIALIALWFVMTQCCIYTSIAVYTVADVCGMNPVICSTSVEGAEYYHAYVRIGATNFETQTLNIYKSGDVDYNNPVYTFDTVSEFTNAVDMSSPIKF